MQASREAVLERMREISVEEKIKAALSIGDNFSWLKPTPLEDDHARSGSDAERC